MHINRSQLLKFTVAWILVAGFPVSSLAGGLHLGITTAPGSLWSLAQPDTADAPFARGRHHGRTTVTGIYRTGSKVRQRIIDAILLFLIRRSWGLEERDAPGFIRGNPV